MPKNRMDWILGELERPSGERPLVVLMTSTHPMTDNNLCKTGHIFYNLDIPQFPIKWTGPVPANMHIIKSLDELPCRPDVIISQNIVDQFNHWITISRLFDCPVISFEHTLPTAEWISQGIPSRLASDLRPITRIFITEFSKNEWQCKEVPNAHVIYHMVDTEKYNGWIGGNGKACLIVNSFSGREWAVGDVETLLVADTAVKGQRIDLYGHNPGYLSKPLTSDEVVKTLQDYDVFINTSLRSPLPAALLEAASVGIPILTTSTCAIGEFFKDDVNCLTFNNIQECIDKLTLLLSDKKLRNRIGKEARNTIEKSFNKERYVADWNKVLSSVIEEYHVYN